MANYAAWDAYDVDRAMLEVDQNEALLDFKPTSAATLTKRVTENLEVIVNATRKTADALRSKAAVAALKQRRVGNAKKDFNSASSHAALDLSLELSVSMEEVNCKLSALFEKVDHLKKSTGISSLQSDLQDGFVLLGDIRKLQETRESLNKIITRINSHNSTIEMLFSLPHDSGSLVFEPSVRKNESLSFQNTDFHAGAQETHIERKIPHEHIIVLSGTLNTLSAVDESMQKTVFFISRYIANVAIHLGEFAVSCDISRYHLKLMEDGRQELSQKTKLNSKSFSGNVIEGQKQGRANSNADDVIVWVIRGLALAGIGSAYLTNLHFRQVKQLAPTYPNIDPVLDYLDIEELNQAYAMRNRPMKNAIFLELSRMVKSKESFPEGYPINIENLNVCQGVSLTLLQYLLNVKYSTETEIDNECTTEIKVEKRKLDLHMEEDDTDDDVIENDSSDNKFHNENSISDMKSSRDEIFDEIKISNASIESIITLIKKQTIEIPSLSKQNLKEENPFERMLSINPILKLARKIFYEGQILYLENLLYSAEIKFLASCLLTSAAIEDNEKRTSENDAISIKNNFNESEKCVTDYDFAQMKTDVSGIEKDLGPRFFPEKDCKTSLELGSDSGIIFDLWEDTSRAYCLNLRSSCLANAALCRSHRSLSTRTNASKNVITSVDAVDSRTNNNDIVVDPEFRSVTTQPQSLYTSPSICSNKLTNDTHDNEDLNILSENIPEIIDPTVEPRPTIGWKYSQNYLSCDILANMSAIELINASFCVPESILLRSRKVIILERLHNFRSALSELDLLENSIPQHPSCDNTPIFGEKNSKIIFGVFEAFSSSRRDFSQINLFSDIVTPLTIHGEIEFNHDRESSDKNLSVDAYHLYDMYSCIMRQITEKRKRLQYLLKRFG